LLVLISRQYLLPDCCYSGSGSGTKGSAL